MENHILYNCYVHFQVLLQFVTIRQFPPADKSLPPLSKSRWWIPTATKVLALINASNNLKAPPMLSYTEFYNISLDHMDLMQVIKNRKCIATRFFSSFT